MVVGLTSTAMPSPIVISHPIRASKDIVVVTSLRCGTLVIVEVELPSSVPARIGSTAFLAPEIRTSPDSGPEPLIRNLSIGVADRWYGPPGGWDEISTSGWTTSLQALTGPMALQLRVRLALTAAYSGRSAVSVRPIITPPTTIALAVLCKPVTARADGSGFGRGSACCRASGGFEQAVDLTYLGKLL